MAALTFTYDHSRDPMNPADLGEKIATAGGLANQPKVDIDPAQITVTHPSITEANRAAIQALINAYVLDPVRASFPEGDVGSMLYRAKQAVTANNTFLAIGAPNAAQVTTQVQRLTRETNALLKIQFSDTDTSGT